MAFDPTKPANNSPVSSSELRSQLTSLKTLIDACPTMSTINTFVMDNSSGNVGGVSELDVVASNPPTQAEVQLIVSKINEMLAAMKRV